MDAIVQSYQHWSCRVRDGGDPDAEELDGTRRNIILLDIYHKFSLFCAVPLFIFARNIQCAIHNNPRWSICGIGSCAARHDPMCTLRTQVRSFNAHAWIISKFKMLLPSPCWSAICEGATGYARGTSTNISVGKWRLMAHSWLTNPIWTTYSQFALISIWTYSKRLARWFWRPYNMINPSGMWKTRVLHARTKYMVKRN